MTGLAALPAFLAYFGLSLGLVAVFLAVYTRLTPHDEWALLRRGNTAAALSLAGATLGFCLPLASAVAHSVGLANMLVWALVALAVQLLWFVALRLFLPDLCETIARGDPAGAVAVAAGSVAVGLLDAACLTY